MASGVHARVLVDGALGDPQLDHPEGIAVRQRDGSVWCGGERGQVYRIDAATGTYEQVASTGGFCLGLAFGPDDRLYVCDRRHAAVMRVDPDAGTVERFADRAGDHRLRIPNAAAFDAEGRLYVSDSHGDDPGPGIVRFEPDGRGAMWDGGPFAFANGLAVTPDGDALLLAETFANRVLRIEICADGSAGARRVLAELAPALPDGLAIGVDGRVYVGCYEPSQVLAIDADGSVATVLHDPTAHLLCHPTNLAFRAGELLAANLGRWHVSALEVGSEGVALPPGRARS